MRTQARAGGQGALALPHLTRSRDLSRRLLPLCALLCVACDDSPAPTPPPEPPPTIATDHLATPGEPIPAATAEQLSAFERGRAVATRRFTPSEGLGPLMNVTFCAGCHEKPVFGGGAGHYRDFYIYGESLPGGGFSALGPRSGVLDTFDLSDPSAFTKREAEPETTVMAARNPVPFFGIGLIAQISEEAILANADPDDLDGDGVSGRPNYDQGYVGRFGVKSQTVSVENFIRGPLFNHLGVTSNPLPAALQAALPVPSVAEARDEGEGAELLLREGALSASPSGEPMMVGAVALESHQLPQAAAPSAPLTDDDSAPDPELSAQELFDLVSWAMLLAAPAPSPKGAEAELGEGLFEAVGCAACHAPTLSSPVGFVPLYSDLLLHDMGEGLADGLVMGLAGGAEFRTAPLWGVVTNGPFLHDGRAHTLEEAIEAHGGEAQGSVDRFRALDADERAAVVSFLESLGGEEVYTEGLLLPGAPEPVVGELGGPPAGISADDLARWRRGRALYDRDIPTSEGLGPHLNGDSCRGCHFEPSFGGAGPIGVSAVRVGYVGADEGGERLARERGAAPPTNDSTLIRRFTAHGGWPTATDPAQGAPHFELRQALPTFGLGALAAIPEAEIIAREDPMDLNGDGVRGVARRLPDGRIGRFGWRAQIASTRDFVADALGMELGLTLSPSLGLVTAVTSDDDEVPDPEYDDARFEDLWFFVEHITPPTLGEVVAAQGAPALAPQGDAAAWLATPGALAFEEVGCGACHISEAWGGLSRPAFTDLLTHDVQGEGFVGVIDGDLSHRAFRTPPLWGIAGTAPYWHDGRAETLEAAVLAHDAEGRSSRLAYEALPPARRAALLEFLRGL